jgi:hypothetical protein
LKNHLRKVLNNFKNYLNQTVQINKKVLLQIKKARNIN